MLWFPTLTACNLFSYCLIWLSIFFQLNISADQWFTNVLNTDKFSNYQTYTKLGKPVDRHQWVFFKPYSCLNRLGATERIVWILSVLACVHTAADSFCTATRRLFTHKNGWGARFLWRSEAAPHWSRKWRVTYRIGSVTLWCSMNGYSDRSGSG